MAYASRSGRARTSPTSPQAFAVCDRCGLWWNWINLQWQYDWRGASLQNLRILVCRPCLDTPQEQLRAIVVPADPLPIIQARVEAFAAAETDYQTITLPLVTDPTTGLPIPSTTVLLAQDGENLTTQPLGIPVGLEQDAIPPLEGTTHYGVVLPILSVIANGTTIVTVTCNAAHGLSNNSQVSIEGLSLAEANGFYSVTVITGTAFAYMTNREVGGGSILTPTTRIVTANVGLPLNYDQIPQTGV